MQDMNAFNLQLQIHNVLMIKKKNLDEDHIWNYLGGGGYTLVGGGGKSGTCV